VVNGRHSAEVRNGEVSYGVSCELGHRQSSQSEEILLQYRDKCLQVLLGVLYVDLRYNRSTLNTKAG